MPLFWCARHGRFGDHRTQDCRLPWQPLARKLEVLRIRAIQEEHQRAAREELERLQEVWTQVSAQQETQARLDAETLEAVRRFIQDRDRQDGS
jgi:hypothetical protein